MFPELAVLDLKKKKKNYYSKVPASCLTSGHHTLNLFLDIPAFLRMPVAKAVFPLDAWPFQNNPPSSLATLISVATHAVLSAVLLLPGQLSVQHP
jgi:hypothetical protein